MSYQWIDNWARVPGVPTSEWSGRTHGLAYSRSLDRVIVFHVGNPAVLFFTPDGRLDRAWGDRFPGAHGLTLAREGEEEFLWLVDQNTLEVVKTTLDGKTVLSIPKPDHPAYASAETPRKGVYMPTWAAQNPVNGEIWVADGYGSWLLHRHDGRGRYLQSIDGSNGASAFSEPHGINFRPGNGTPELFVTDRANHRVAVFDGEGNFLRASNSCHSPCCFDFLGQSALVPELFTGVKILSADSLEVIAHLGENPEVQPRSDGGWWPPVSPKGWPDLQGTEHVKPDRFNSPHGACFGPDGAIYVGEWIFGGRLTKLQPV